ncbi:flagellar assembly protein FliH [Anoxybacteroides tepidamans]|uniref:flagellar assembly protein FliH n=1 Tax=Anoxybacteroides tepidamans TaxID=265948 RepID=UPI000487BD7D|nr:flagellar assembly protein FliH [Anoxybacillus tepidamans]
MILLSKVIKASFTKTDHGSKKIIEVKNCFQKQAEVSFHVEMDEGASAQNIVEQAEREAKLIKQEAEKYYHSLKQQILQERENWQLEKQQLMLAAQQEGYEAGYTQGKEEGLQSYHECIEEARRVIQAANEQFYEQIESAKETIFLIGLKVAERILGEKISENNEHFLSLVQRAMKEVREQSEVKLYVHPFYYEMVVQQKDELKAVFNQPADIFIYPDEQLAKDGCVIETPFGRIDASVDTQLQQIKEKLLERLKEE